ncbi:TraR/DksA family transcriptional regulator [Paraburkholderia sp. RL17-337-BIB-A]|uniref:TraR/DksA family transcriptional regulator n=1 Tax=Paraburkholderia sp. RL17-337-BIB-A TaxID=3031636 RepID=UPI0038B898C6
MLLSARRQSELRDLLTRRETALRSALARDGVKNDDQSYAELATPVGDEGERAYAEQVLDERLAMSGHLASELEAIARAHRRLQAGTYGICVDCDENIPLARLLVCPAATRCEACQASHEHALRR